MVHRSPSDVPVPAPAAAGPARRRRNLWLGVGIGGLALLFYATIILKTGVLGVPPGFR